MLDLLVVDDNEDHVKLIAAVLADEQRVLWLADSAERAIELMQERAYAMAIFDVRIPLADGIDLAAIMHKAHAARAPVLFLSAAPLEPANVERIEALSCAYELMLKPFDLVALDEAATRLLRRGAQAASDAALTQSDGQLPPALVRAEST